MSIEYDLNDYLNEQAFREQEYEQAVDETKEQLSTIDGFLQDIYTDISDEDMMLLQECLNKKDDASAGMILRKYYDKHVLWILENES